MESPALRWKSAFKPRQPAEQNAIYWKQTRGQKSVPDQTRSIANLKLKSERRQNMQPALRNCQQEMLGYRTLLLNQAVTEAKEQKSLSREAKTSASKGGGCCATGLLHPILCNSILKLGGKEEITWQPVITEIIISHFRERRGIKIIFSFGGCQGTWPTIPHQITTERKPVFIKYFYQLKETVTSVKSDSPLICWCPFSCSNSPQHGSHRGFTDTPLAGKTSWSSSCPRSGTTSSLVGLYQQHWCGAARGLQASVPPLLKRLHGSKQRERELPKEALVAFLACVRAAVHQIEKHKPPWMRWPAEPCKTPLLLSS